MEDSLSSQQQHDNDDAVAAAAAAAAAAQLGLGDLQSGAHQQHHFHHNLQQPDFSHTKDDGSTPHQDVDVHSLDIPVEGHDDVGLSGQEPELDLSLSMATTPHDNNRNTTYGRPPSIRKGGL